VQEVFARALVKLPTFDYRASFSTWLHGIAINTVRNHWRSQRTKNSAHQKLREIQEVRGATEDRMDQMQLCKERARVVYAILADLPEHLREAFVLRDLEGYSPAEAAEQLGITPGNLSVRATRARERIRKELEKLGMLAPRMGGS
jgi:RNA polymerase sigma-70 factor (ECF subfamily)